MDLRTLKTDGLKYALNLYDEMIKKKKTVIVSAHQLTEMLHCIVQYTRCCLWLLQFIVDAAT